MIDRCVLCGYFLEGLPTIHPCPECGRENDRESVAITEPRVAAKISTSVGAIVFVTVVVLAWRRGFSASSLPMAAVAVALIATAWVQVSRRARTIVVSRRSLELIDESSKVRSYPTENLDDARWSFVTGTTKVTDRRGRVIVTIPSKFLGSNRANRKVVSAIQAVVARRAAPAFAENAAPAE